MARSRTGRFLRRRRVRRHRNPVKHHHSPAMRAKISRAVKAAMRSKRGGSSARRTSTAVVRRPRRRTIIRVASPVSRRRRSSVIRRRSSRRKSFMSRFGGSSSIGFKSLFDRQTLMVAGGAVAGQFVTRFVLGKWGASLPMIKNADGSVNQYGLIGYQLVLPLAGAMVIKRFNPTLAKGMLIGGVISAINTGINLVQGLSLTPTVGASEYLDASRSVGALPPGYAAVDQFSSAMSPTPAFSGDAWSK